MGWLAECRIAGRAIDLEIPASATPVRLSDHDAMVGNHHFWISTASRGQHYWRKLEAGSLAGAAHLGKNSRGAQSEAQRERKSLVARKGKSLVDVCFSSVDKDESQA